MTGNYKVPTLELDDGTLVDGSEAIIEWAQANAAASVPRNRLHTQMG